VSAGRPGSAPRRVRDARGRRGDTAARVRAYRKGDDLDQGVNHGRVLALRRALRRRRLHQPVVLVEVPCWGMGEQDRDFGSVRLTLVRPHEASEAACSREREWVLQFPVRRQTLCRFRRCGLSCAYGYGAVRAPIHATITS
jgi:hypothetical protein